MKKTVSMLLALAMVFSLTACGSKQEATVTQVAPAEAAPAETEEKAEEAAPAAEATEEAPAETPAE